MSDIIKIAIGELNTAFENEVMKAVQNVGISVDKEKLIKALELSDRLVRCKECRKTFEAGGEIICHHLSGMVGCNVSVNPDDFCSYGERSDNE